MGLLIRVANYKYDIYLKSRILEVMLDIFELNLDIKSFAPQL